MSRSTRRAVEMAAGMVLCLVGAASADPAANDPWPGYVPGGQFFRDVEWGVSFWGPGAADIQRLPDILVRYSVQASGGRPGWVITAVASKVREELAAEQLLTSSANQLKQALGDRVSQIETRKFDGPGPAVGQLTCRIAPAAGGAAGQGGAVHVVVHKVYVYFRLRPKQYLVLVGETTPAGAEAIGQLLDVLRGSVTVFDPPGADLAEAARRTAKLIEQLTPQRAGELAAKAPAVFFRTYHRPPTEPGRGAAEPVVTGFAYQVIVAGQGRGEVESIASFHSTAPGATATTYRSAYVNLGGGEDVIRVWSRTTPPADAQPPAQPFETFLVARRRGQQFELAEKATGERDRTSTVKIPNGPYLPLALQGLMLPLMAKQVGQLHGALAFSPAEGRVLFQTIEPVGAEKLALLGRPADAMKWTTRSSPADPQQVRWTDPSGIEPLRVATSPNEWAEVVEANQVPADIRRILTTPPQWP